MYTSFFSLAKPPIFSWTCNSKHTLHSSRYDRGDRSYDRGYDRYDRPQYHDRYDRYDRAYDKYDRYDRSRSRSYSPRKSSHQVFCLDRSSFILSLIAHTVRCRRVVWMFTGALNFILYL